MTTFAPGSAASHIKATSASEAPVTICTDSTGTTLHFSDRLTQAVGAGGAAVDQVVVQEAVTRFVVGEGEDVVYGPGRPGARSEVEFYVVFVLVEPGVEQEGLELHAGTSEKLVPGIDSASHGADDFLFTSAENPASKQFAANRRWAASAPKGAVRTTLLVRQWCTKTIPLTPPHSPLPSDMMILECPI